MSVIGLKWMNFLQGQFFFSFYLESNGYSVRLEESTDVPNPVPMKLIFNYALSNTSKVTINIFLSFILRKITTNLELYFNSLSKKWIRKIKRSLNGCELLQRKIHH